MASTFSTTTRLTSPSPIGADKMYQDAWDGMRERIVRGKMSYETNKSFINFMVNMRDKVDEVAAGPIFQTNGPVPVAVLYGAYDITDKSASNDKWLLDQMKRINVDKKMFINGYMRKNNVVAVKHGIRETGIVEFADGSYEVCDPTKGVQTNGKKVKSIRQIATLYCSLIRLSKETPYPIA